MGTLLQIAKASKQYGDQVLLDQAEAVIADNVKIGFVGRNGAGKSTLLRVFLGEEELDSGKVMRHPNLRLGYLRQHDPFVPGESALDYLMRDSGRPAWRCGEVAGRFEIKGTYLNGPIQELSGGWQTRVKLTALLLNEPNLLLLDEPTNFLDLRTQILLEHFLTGYDGGCLIVSHDRAFLSATCDQTLGLSRGKLMSFPGKVDAYLQFVRERREHDERSNEAVMVKKRHLEDFVARNKARASTAKLAQSKSKMLEKLEFTEVVHDEPVVRIRTPRIEPRKGIALRCKDLSIGYPDRTIATDIQLELDHGSRAAIVGDNGHGKTTFLRTIVDSLKPKEGEVRWGHGCSIGVYAQHVYTALPEGMTVYDYLRKSAPLGVKDQEVLDVAGSFLFKGKHVEKPISVLSGGERARLCLAALLLSKHNVLILDEPGNHLDVDTVDALIDSLKEYQGTLIFTSHDRHFTGQVATCVIEVRDGRVTNYNGKYAAYLEKVNEEIEAGEREQAAAKASLPQAVLKPGRATTRTAEQIRADLANAEREMARLETVKQELDAKYVSARDPKELDRLYEELITAGGDLGEAEDQWTALQAELDALA